MQRIIFNKFTILLLLSFVMILSQCIEPFTPKINESVELLVINGSVIKEADIQTVTVSRTTALDDDVYNPVLGCSVWVTNDNGVEFQFRETSEGVYTTSISENHLGFQNGFTLSVVTPDGNEYQSDYEVINISSEIDSIYYAIEGYQSSELEADIGLQFYCDLKADESATKHYMWKQTETYEVHTLPFSGMVYDENLVIEDFGTEIDTIAICYPVLNVGGFTCASTKNLTVNEKKMIPLRYVVNTSPKLNYNYSNLIYQYSLSDAAYDYWSRIQSLSSESGGLYQSQPYNVRSNICNLNDESEIVLGYFWASSRSERRINFEGPLTDINPINSCLLDTLALVMPMFREGRYYSPPWYLYPEQSDMGILWLTGKASCFDCRLNYGSNKKPDFFE